MVPPVLAVVVASLGVQAARMRGEIGGWDKRENGGGGEIRQLRHGKSHLG